MNLLQRITTLPPRTGQILLDLVRLHPDAAMEVEKSLSAREAAIAAKDAVALRAAFESDKALIMKYLEDGLKEEMIGSI